MRTIGGWRNEIARALPVGRSPIAAAVSRECSRPTRIPSLMSAVSWVGVPSSSNGSVPRSREAAPLSPTLRTGFPKRRPRVIISRACGFSYTKSASERCPNASWMNTPASSGSSTTGYVPPVTVGASSNCTARSAVARKPAALSWTECQPRRSPIDSSPFSMVPSRHATHVAVQIEDRLSLLRHDLAEPDRALEPHRARQLVGPGDHGGELVQRCKRGGTPARAAVQGAHEPALVLARGGGLEPPATHGDGGGPGLLDADFGEVGAGGGERRGEPVDQPPSSLSFSA